MHAKRRQDLILKHLKRNDQVLVAELADQFGSSQETIRRDLNVLAERGLVVKFHGGAELPKAIQDEDEFQTRLEEHVEAKRAIADLAASLFHTGDNLFIDTGTTTLFFAKSLSQRSGLTIITNSLMIASAVGNADNRVFVVGGEYYKDAEENLGALALDQISRFHARHAVITIGAISPSGAMDYLVDEAEVARAMVQQSDYLTVIADSSKMNQHALFKVIELDRIDRLVTDTPPSGDLLEALQDANVQILTP